MQERLCLKPNTEQLIYRAGEENTEDANFYKIHTYIYEIHWKYEALSTMTDKACCSSVQMQFNAAVTVAEP